MPSQNHQTLHSVPAFCMKGLLKRYLGNPGLKLEELADTAYDIGPATCQSYLAWMCRQACGFYLNPIIKEMLQLAATWLDDTETGFVVSGRILEELDHQMRMGEPMAQFAHLIYVVAQEPQPKISHRLLYRAFAYYAQAAVRWHREEDDLNRANLEVWPIIRLPGQPTYNRPGFLRLVWEKVRLLWNPIPTDKALNYRVAEHMRSNLRLLAS